jgi:hypothetical protein
LRHIAKSKGKKIASLNINSLLKHIDEIRVLLTEYTFDILAINESKIDNSDIMNYIYLGMILFGKTVIEMGVVWFYMSRDNIPFLRWYILKLIGQTSEMQLTS